MFKIGNTDTVLIILKIKDKDARMTSIDLFLVSLLLIIQYKINTLNQKILPIIFHM